MSKSRAFSRSLLTLLWSVLLGAVGCGRSPSSSAEARDGAKGRTEARASRSGGSQAPVLTKEEVGAILGKPVTTVEGKGANLTYKTDEMLLETNVEVERRGMDDAVRAIAGARTATGFLGGKPEEVPGLGDEGFFGAMSILYVRKGDAFITVTPPNFQQIAGIAAYGKVTEAKGADETRRAMEELQKTQQTDPANAGLASGNAVEGALATIKASSQKQGTEYEARGRAVAVALATKVLEKL